MMIRTTRPMLSLMIAALTALLVLLPGCESKVSLANYEEITVGMSFSQVESLLGSGEQEISGGTSIGASGLIEGSSDAASERQTWTWTDGDSVIVVNFINSEVVSKSKRGL